ncbi:MAG TPA: DUF1294 domain-containing protein [Planctomycetota bacterium]|nr:DUF1294 domain-containing protein [Planctomycetota bacterium]
MAGWTLVLAVYAVMSVVTLVAFKLDKSAAVQGLRRTPEATLHLLELLGGWPGGLIAMILLRHKNRKASYIAVFVGIVLLHAVGWWLALR